MFVVSGSPCPFVACFVLKEGVTYRQLIVCGKFKQSLSSFVAFPISKLTHHLLPSLSILSYFCIPVPRNDEDILSVGFFNYFVQFCVKFFYDVVFGIRGRCVCVYHCDIAWLSAELSHDDSCVHWS